MVVLSADRGGVTAAFWIGCAVAMLALLADLGTPVAPALPIAAFAAYVAVWGGGAGRAEAARPEADRVVAMAALVAACALGRAVALETLGLRGVIPGDVVTDLACAIAATVTGLALREALLVPVGGDCARRSR